MTDKINELMALARALRYVEPYGLQDADEALHQALEAALKDCRNAALEEAAVKIEASYNPMSQTEQTLNALNRCERLIRSLKT